MRLLAVGARERGERNEGSQCRWLGTVIIERVLHIVTLSYHYKQSA